MSFKTLVRQLTLWANKHRVQQLISHSQISVLVDTLNLRQPALWIVVLQGLHDTLGQVKVGHIRVDRCIRVHQVRVREEVRGLPTLIPFCLTRLVHPAVNR